MKDRKGLFDFMLERVVEVATQSGLKPPQAFARWFADTYFLNPIAFYPSDGTGDGKVDSFFQVSTGKELTHYVVNTKFTQKFDVIAPVSFYDELTRFWQAFANKPNRKAYLKNLVRPELRNRYQALFNYYDDGRARLFFVTNHRRNESQYESIKKVGVETFHLEELLQFVLDYMEDTMPRTPTLRLTGINTVLSADQNDTLYPTSIVFAKVIDLIRYMTEEDPYDLLFARNIRLKLKNSKVNPDIRETFSENPREFVFSNNGITMLCESHPYDTGKKSLDIRNPRVVNGSQTLHMVREVEDPSSTARVMVRIIEVPPPSAVDFSQGAIERRRVIEKIAVRSNFQNPIRKWNLISNDVYQHELARFFRKKKLYYERRDGEWAQRKTELKAVGLQRGPHIKRILQLIASYYWEDGRLGPVVAKRGFEEMFEAKKKYPRKPPYETIARTSPELVYQLYLLDEVLWSCLRELSKERKYVDEISNYIRFALFALCVKALQAKGLSFGKSDVTKLLEKGANPHRKWLDFCKSGANLIWSEYKNAAVGREKELTIANFTKADEHIGKLLKRPVPAKLGQVARQLVQLV